MSHGVLDRPGDRASRLEEEAIWRMNAQKREAARELEEILFVLPLTASRSRRAKARGGLGDQDLAIERRVQDRRLDALIRLRPELRHVPPVEDNEIAEVPC